MPTTINGARPFWELTGSSGTPLVFAAERPGRGRWPLHVIEDCGDGPHLEQPGEFLRALRAGLGEAQP